MLYNPEAFSRLLDQKMNQFGALLNDKFNEKNGTESLTFKSENAMMLHHLRSRNAPVRIEDYSVAEIQEQKDVEAEEIRRLKALITGEYKAYTPTEEDLSILSVTLEEIKNTLMSEEDYLTLLGSINEKI